MMMEKQVREKTLQKSPATSTKGQFDPRPFAYPGPEHEALDREARFGHSFAEIDLFPIQPKLVVGSPDDKYEREADRVAEQVMRMSEPTLATLKEKDHQFMSNKRGNIQKVAIQRQPVKDSESDEEREEELLIHTEDRLEQQLRILEKEELERQEEERRRGRIPHIQRKNASLQSPFNQSKETRALSAIINGGYRLPQKMLNFFEPRFGYDFSQVRIHKDTQAAESAQVVDALAYTVGRDIIFGAGQFAPETFRGKKLLAHELTHVIQQTRMVDGHIQREERRRPRPPPVDANAQRIIDLAQDTNRPIAERAVAVVQAIINQYFSTDSSKISQINYSAGEPGLRTTYAGQGASITGIIEVGSYFVQQTDQRHFARRVLQVRHEIEHVEQHRRGMRGETRADEREFLAFYHEALAVELPGTGRLQHSTRVQLIDTALSYYYCLTASLQQAHTTKRDELLARRPQEVRQSGSSLGTPPTTCSRP